MLNDMECPKLYIHKMHLGLNDDALAWRFVLSSSKTYADLFTILFLTSVLCPHTCAAGKAPAPLSVFLVSQKRKLC